MKKGLMFLSICLAVLLGVVYLIGCTTPAPATTVPAPSAKPAASPTTSAPAPAQPTATAAQEKWPATLVIDGMGVGTSANMVATAIGEAIRKETGIATQVVAGTAETVRVSQMAKHETDMGFTLSDISNVAFNGKSLWDGKPAKDLRMINLMTYSVYHIITWPGTGINSTADLKGKTIMGDRQGVPGGMPSPLIDTVLKLSGLTRNDVKIVNWSAYGDMINFIRLQQGDLIFLGSGIKTAPLLELDRTIKWKYLSLSDKEIAEVMKVAPYVTPWTMPGGTYTQQPEPVTTVQLPMIFSVNVNVPDSLVYQVCKILYDTPGRFATVDPVWGKFDIKQATIPRALPYAAGAIKYFQEKGVWSADADKWNKEILSQAGMTK